MDGRAREYVFVIEVTATADVERAFRSCQAALLQGGATSRAVLLSGGLDLSQVDGVTVVDAW